MGETKSTTCVKMSGKGAVVLEDLAYVLPQAVEVYKAAAIRNRPKEVGYTSADLTPEEVVDMFPAYYALQSEGKLKFVGQTADEILETYLVELGYERCSLKWFELAHLVVNMAIEEGKDIESIIGEVRPAERGKRQSRNSKPPKTRFTP